MYDYLKHHIPNCITFSRLAFTPLLVPLALSGKPRPLLLLGLALMVADALDGMLARLWHTTSRFGQYLDGWVDTVFHTVFLALVLQYLAVQLDQVWPLILLPILCLMLPWLLGRQLTGKMRSMHLVSKKVASWFYLAWIVTSLLGEFNMPLLIVLNVIAVGVFVEQMSLYLMMRERLDDTLVSLFQVWQPWRRREPKVVQNP
jgi:phosphatidylglycerophosphate synthase